MMQLKRVKERLKRFYWNAATMQLDGIGIIEIILILVIIIGLVLIFRNKIEGIMKSAFSSISGDSSEISKDLNVG